MNILIINWRDIRHPLSGGAEMVTMEHAKRWVNVGHHVTWLTSSYKDAKREETIEGVNLIRSGGSLTVYLAAPIYLLLNRNTFDVIVDEVHGIPFFSPIFTQKPVVVFIHEIAGEIWDYMYTFPINIVGKKLESFYFYLYRKHYFWTDATSTIDELVKRGIPRHKCIAIPCPPIKTVVVHVNKSSEPTYIFLSRVVKMKGIEEVIKAFAFIRVVQKSARLWIVGGGEEQYLEKLQRMVDDYKLTGSVFFWGRVDVIKKYELLSQAHILLHASVKEGWGLVVLEAALCGTPTISYDVAGLRDVVKDGLTGKVIRNNTPKELAEEAVRLVNDKKRYRIYQEAGKKWVASLSWDNSVKQSLKLLKTVIHEKTH